MFLREIGTTIKERREALGLSQRQLANFADLSRQTINGLENGSLEDLGYNRLARITTVLALRMMPLHVMERRAQGGLWMAAKTASVSYRDELTPELLENALMTGEIPTGFRPHMAHLFDESPIELMTMAVEEVALRQHMPPRHVWRHVARMAQALPARRAALWS